MPHLPVVFLHGFPGSRGDFVSILQKVSQTRPASALVMPWAQEFPETSLPEQLNLGFVVQACLQQIKSIANSPVHLIGHDIGGLAGYWIDAFSPPSVASLSVISSPHPNAYRQAFQDLEASGRRGYIHELTTTEDLSGFGYDGILSETDLTEEDRARLRQNLANTRMNVIRDFYLSSLSEKAIMTAPRLPASETPGRTYFGRHENYIPASVFEASTQFFGSHSDAIGIDTSSHYLHLSHSDILVDNMLLFWNKVEQGEQV